MKFTRLLLISCSSLSSCLFFKPKRLFLILLLSIPLLSVGYLVLLKTNFIRNRGIARLLRIEPTGPKTFIYDKSTDKLFLLPENSAYAKTDKLRPLILFWTPKYGVYSLDAWGAHSNVFDGCEAKCDLSIDQTLIDKADAVVFHPGIDMFLRTTPPEQRWPHQIYVMQWAESPRYTILKLNNYENFFNWTMTYRRSSDVYIPYGMAVPRAKNLTTIPERYSRKRKKMVAWLVSSCYSFSHREDIANELAKYVQVDVYGKCGTFSCPANEANVSCISSLASDYKFYLSFENSLCQDYVTEKFFNPLREGMVPIYYGGHGIERIAPPGPSPSYINVFNFSSIKALGDYLLHLAKDENEGEYLSFFDWTKAFVAEHFSSDWCALCTKLIETGVTNRNRTATAAAVVPTFYDRYTSINSWWNGRDERGNQICLENPSYVEEWKAFLDYAL